MSDDPRSKRYYWLKLDKDFFDKHYIKIIEAQPNGKDYALFYLKLLVESISYEGNLRISEAIPYDLMSLSAITNTNPDIVKSAIQLFIQLGLVDVLEDHTFYMTKLNEMIGSETIHAKQKRLLRQSRDNVSDLSRNCLIENRVRDKSIDIKEKESKKKSDLVSKKETTHFIKPTIQEIENYIKEKSYSIDPNHFYDYYEARNWELSKGRKMKDWKATVRTWSYKQKEFDKINQEKGKRNEKFEPKWLDDYIEKL